MYHRKAMPAAAGSREGVRPMSLTAPAPSEPGPGSGIRQAAQCRRGRLGDQQFIYRGETGQANTYGYKLLRGSRPRDNFPSG
jgi:hypothetical protein